MNNSIYNSYYIINLPIKNYIFSSYKTIEGVSYNQPKITISNNISKGWITESTDKDPYLELIIPEAERDKTIIGFAVQGNDVNYPRKFMYKTTTTLNYSNSWELYDNNSTIIEKDYNNSENNHLIYFKIKKTNLKKILIKPSIQNNSWVGETFSLKIALIIEYNINDENIVYNDYDLINKHEYYYKLKYTDGRNTLHTNADCTHFIESSYSNTVKNYQ